MSTSDAAAWVTAGATFLAVLVALFREDIARLWRRPKLVAMVRLAAPDCHKTVATYANYKTGKIEQGPCYYLRVWVENKGNLRAEQVQVFAAKLLRRHADGTFREEKQFLPMNLRWAHSRDTSPEIFAEGISPLMGKHCDLGHILDPKIRARTGQYLPDVSEDQTILALDLEVAPNTLSHLVAPGIYRLELRIAAANCRPVTKILEINHTGQWYDDEARMFADGLGLRKIS